MSLLIVAEFLLLGLLTVVPVLLSVAFYTVLERKVMASIQRRRGPTEVGWWGLLQAFADGLKLLVKEVIVPIEVRVISFFLAPLRAFTLSLTNWSLRPRSKVCRGLIDSTYSMFLIIVLSSLMVYRLIFAGWSSNSRYAFLGGIRAAAQRISYELTFTFVVLLIAALTGSVNFAEIAFQQDVCGPFFYFLWPLALAFIIIILAETNRTPFDLPEAEAELVAGYNVEYSAIPFRLFFLREYSNILLMSFRVVFLFFGGWSYFVLKIIVRAVFFIVRRALLPRLRYDQLRSLGWKNLLPLLIGYSFILYGILLI